MKIDLELNASPQCAIFVADAQGNNSSQKLQDTMRENAAKDQLVQLIGQCAALLPLPSKLPTLCLFVATAQVNGHKYMVQLFGQPLLVYSSDS